MTIKNKDGTEYKLSKPNPLMAAQEKWSEYILHNKYGKLVTPEEEKPLEQKKEEPQIVRTLNEPEMETVVNSDIIQVWCLPAIFKQYKDDVYGEEYKKIIYGVKFMFEAVLIDETDIKISLIASTSAITENSVIFPRTIDRRWWRVESVKKEDENYIIEAIISDYHPEFSS